MSQFLKMNAVWEGKSNTALRTKYRLTLREQLGVNKNHIGITNLQNLEMFIKRISYIEKYVKGEGDFIFNA